MARHLSEDGSSITEEGSSESIVRINIVRLPNFTDFTFIVDKNILISRFKERMAHDINISADQQILLLTAVFAKDDRPLSQYYLGYEHSYHVVMTWEGLRDSPVSSTEANVNMSTTGSDFDPAAIQDEDTFRQETDDFHDAINILSSNLSSMRSDLDRLNNQMDYFEDIDAVDETHTDAILLRCINVILARIERMSRKMNGLIENFMKMRMGVHFNAYCGRVGILPRS